MINLRTNPTTANVRATREIWETGGFDALIALGGGSSIDTAKGAMAEILTGKEAIACFGQNVDRSDRPLPPFYAIPTTSGTGSESSLGAVLKSPERKFVIRGALLQPRTVIMDPELTLSLPPGMTAATGFDAFCHAIGAYTNTSINPVADELALAAIRLALEHLPVAVDHGDDLEARSGLMQASYLGGVCIGQKGVDGIHGLCTPVESLIPAVHGQVLGTLLPYVLRYNFETQAKRYAEISKRLGLDGNPVEAIFDAATGLAALTGCPARLGDYGITQGDIPRLTEMALLSQATQRNGREMPAENITKLYETMI